MHWRYLLLIPWLCLSCAPAPSGVASDPLERAVDEVLAAPFADRQFAGVVLIEQDGRPLLRKAYGRADRELGTPNGPETPFMIMSVSKQLTAALVLRLAAKGRLGLQDPVGKYLDRWPDEWRPVTVHHLLSHSSGLDIDTTYFWLVANHPEYWAEPGVTPPPYAPRALVTPPGSTFLYSNVGYTLLTRVAAAAGGKNFDSLLREEVLEPVGMSHTRPERGERVAGRARGYQPTADGFELSEQGTRDIVGAGDLVSTVDDLARWNRALDDEAFLPAPLRAAMLTAHLEDPQRGGVGYGWFLRQSAGGRSTRFHTGSGAGFRAYNYRLPEQRLSVIVLSNVFVAKTPWVPELLERVAALAESPASTRP